MKVGREGIEVIYRGKAGRCGRISTKGLKYVDRPCLGETSSFDTLEEHTSTHSCVSYHDAVKQVAASWPPLPLPFFLATTFKTTFLHELTDMFKTLCFKTRWVFTQSIPRLIKVFALAVSSPLLDRLSSVHAWHSQLSAYILLTEWACVCISASSRLCALYTFPVCVCESVC